MKRHWATSHIRFASIHRGVFSARTGSLAAAARPDGAALIFFWAALLICLWVTAVPLARADSATTVDAQVDRTVVPPGESVQLTVAIHNGGGDVDTGPLTDFRVLSTGTSTSLQIINGVSSREEDHSYTLIPRRTGHLTIPALAVSVNGHSFKTQPIEITVSNQRSTAAAYQGKEIWVDSSVSDSRPYVGQQITYTFSFYQAVQVADATFQAPDFSGYTSDPIKDHSSEHRIINGREYLVTSLQYVLVPLEAGSHSIAPGVLQLSILRPGVRRHRDPFDGFFNDPFFNRRQVEPKVLQSKPVSVQVQPLPPYAGSDPFSGLVGQFKLTANIEDTRLKVNDSTTLAITVQGHGNIMDAQAPSLKIPDTLKSYADSPQSQVQLKPNGYTGKKTYRTALVPLKSGTIQLPPVHLTYFDVDQGRYRTLTAPLPALMVQPAAEPQAPPLTVTAEPSKRQKQEVAFTGHDILPPKEDLEALQSHRPLAWPFFLMHRCWRSACFT
jgi:hypothetical protein